MSLLLVLSQLVLYVCLAVLTGSFIVMMVPERYRPDVTIKKSYLIILAICIPFVSFVPVLESLLIISPRIGLWDGLQLVFTTYTVGTAWVFTISGAVLLLLFLLVARITEKRVLGLIGLFLSFWLMLTIALSSHAASMDGVIGIVSDFVHLAAASIWAGVILVIGWCSTNYRNWNAFLNWFTMMAVSCLFAIVVSGLLLMGTLVDDYQDAWLVSYGQGLLIKHLFLLPLFFYALINGFLIKYLVSKNASFNPLPWVRLEGIVLFIIFTVTAVYSQQPPANGNYLSSDMISPLFRIFHGDSIDANSTIHFAPGEYSIYLFFIIITLIGFTIASFLKRLPLFISFLCSCLVVVGIYITIMISITV